MKYGSNAAGWIGFVLGILSIFLTCFFFIIPIIGTILSIVSLSTSSKNQTKWPAITGLVLSVIYLVYLPVGLYNDEYYGTIGFVLLLYFMEEYPEKSLLIAIVLLIGIGVISAIVARSKNADFKCSICNKIVPYNSTRCPYCGAIFEEKNDNGYIEKTIVCQDCGGEVTDDEKYCHHCGAKFKIQEENENAVNQKSEIICSNCEQIVDNDDNYCLHCGAELITEESELSDDILLCSNCKNEVSNDSKFCPFCGIKFE